jgi:hypothetical protein
VLNIMTLVVALATGAPVTPFPAPKVIALTDTLKCTWGPIVSATAARVIVTTEHGPVTIQLGGAAVPVVSDDGRQLDKSALLPGKNVRVYYVVDNGAMGREIDFEAAK